MNRFFMVAAIAALCMSTVNAASYCFSYSFTGAISPTDPGYSIVASGIITTNDTLSTTGQSVALITGVSGTRVFTSSTNTQTLSFTGLASSATADNLVYSIWPFTSFNGWSFSLDGVAQTAYGTGANSVNVVITYDPLLETTGSQTSYVGDLVVQVSSQITSLAQCPSSLSNPVHVNLQYSFCYTISSDGTDSYSLSGTPWTTFAYGVFTATTPVQQEGRASVILTSMSGVRVLNYNNTSITQRIVSVKPAMSDLPVGVKTDNFWYLSAPFLDQYGLLFTLDSGVWYPDGQLSTTDINLEYDQFASLQYIDLSADGTKWLQSSRQWADYQIYTGGSVSFSCPGAPSNWSPAGLTSTSSSSSLSGGAIAGIVIGTVVGGLLILAVLAYIVIGKRGGKQSAYSKSTENTVQESEESHIEIH